MIGEKSECRYGCRGGYQKLWVEGVCKGKVQIRYASGWYERVNGLDKVNQICFVSLKSLVNK